MGIAHELYLNHLFGRLCEVSNNFEGGAGGTCPLGPHLLGAPQFEKLKPKIEQAQGPQI